MCLHIKGVLARAGCVLLAAICFGSVCLAKSHSEEPPKLQVRVEAPPADVLQAVKQVTQDQIVHGTYSYEKERILYGAHSADAAHVFGVWKGQGTVFYKVANNVLAPRYFKDTGDIGTISVRYVVQDAGPAEAILQIDAVFVDARTIHHPSLGNVEAAEYAAIQEHLRNMQSRRAQAEQRAAFDSKPLTARPPTQPQATPTSGPSVPAEQFTVPEMRKHVEALRHQVELRVKDGGAQLKSSPFHSAATLETLPAQSDVLIVILSPYWYGVETEDGHRGWVHHAQLEPLP